MTTKEANRAATGIIAIGLVFAAVVGFGAWLFFDWVMQYAVVDTRGMW